MAQKKQKKLIPFDRHMAILLEDRLGWAELESLSTLGLKELFVTVQIAFVEKKLQSVGIIL